VSPLAVWNAANTGGLGPARDHEAFAEHEILEPALLRHHAMRGGIEVGHA
jgi:hypothetical protein